MDAGGLYSRLLVEVGLIGTLLYLMFVVAILAGLAMVARRPTVDDDMRRYAGAVFFSIVADGVQRLSFVGIATDAHLWVMFGLGLALIELARPAEGHARLIERHAGAVSPARVG